MYDQTKQTIDEYRKDRVSSKGELYDKISDILFRNDPVGIAYFDNVDEYEVEVNTIIPRLEKALSDGDVKAIVYEEFMRWFNDGNPSTSYGNDQIYDKISKEIWDLIKDKQ